MAYRLCPEPIGPGMYEHSSPQQCRQLEDHEGPHSWPMCLNIDPGSEYECQHACELELGHGGPHLTLQGWGDGWDDYPLLHDLLKEME